MAGDDHIIHHSHQEATEDDHDEDTLSFCDLPIYSGDSSDFDNEDHSFSSSLSSSSSDQDCFEFHSGDWSSSSITLQNFPVHQKIVFCGKIIPPKDLPVSDTPNNSPSHESLKKRGFFLWTPNFLGRPKSKRQPKLRCDSRAESLEKSRWLTFLMFGLERLPEEMDLSDNKTNQQRRPPSLAGARLYGRVRSGKVFWGLIRGLGCGSRHHHRLHHHRHQPCPVIRQ